MYRKYRHKVGRWLLFTLLLINTALASNVPVSSQAATNDGTTDYDLQAVLIYKIGVSYVEWPTVTSSNGVKILNVCIIGSSPGFLNSLQVVQGKVASKLKINISQVNDGDNLSACNIVYIAKNKTNYKEILNSIAKQPILTMSQISKFAINGGMIEMSLEETGASSGAPTDEKATIHFVINNKVASAANIKIAPDFMEGKEVIR